MPPSAAQSRHQVDKKVWMAAAGPAAKLPAVGSLAYYFVEGHAEQSSSPPDFSSIAVQPYALCRVTDVKLLANPDSDEVFAKISLDPTLPPPAVAGDGDGGDAGGEVASFVKVLTSSDANNGGGFSVPRFCAELIFPKLDYSEEPPTRLLTMKDVHGVGWVLRHIYRGTPRRHLLTSGWSVFVTKKKLIAGDSIVFIKRTADGAADAGLYVGIRRVGRCFGGAIGTAVKEGSGFSRNVKGRVPAETVVEAARLMELGRPFEVLYYPKAGMPDFVVPKEVVEAAMQVGWNRFRVKMALETEDLRSTWFQGTVTCCLPSPWRMLQVTWDEPEVLQNLIRVNPWQVELVSTPQQLQTPYPPLKRFKIPEFPGLSAEWGNISNPTAVYNGPGMGNLTSSTFGFNTFPAGMQGARHDVFVPSLSNWVPRNTHQMFSDNLQCSNASQEGSTPQSGVTPSSSQESGHQLELLGAKTWNPIRKASKRCLRLFGQIIFTDQRYDDGADKDSVKNNGGVRSLDFSVKESPDNNGGVRSLDFSVKESPDNNGGVRSLDFSVKESPDNNVRSLDFSLKESPDNNGGVRSLDFSVKESPDNNGRVQSLDFSVKEYADNNGRVPSLDLSLTNQQQQLVDSPDVQPNGVPKKKHGPREGVCICSKCSNV